MSHRPWREAMQDALYGPDGFYMGSGRGPGHDYRTSSTASPVFASALLRLLAEVDTNLGKPPVLDLVEVGAAQGTLLQQIALQADAHHPDLAGRLRLHGVDLGPRPGNLEATIGWSAEVPPLTGLLFANEWLDNVPLDVVELTEAGPRLVLVDSEGSEELGPPPSAEDQQWLDAWWPLDEAEPGDRAEIGRTRDEAWAKAVSQVEAGVAIAVDYAHLRADRANGSYAPGTLTGYRNGRQTIPTPDASSDVTAHVALDSAAEAATADATAIADQRNVLRALGVTGARPQASDDSTAYLRALETCSEEAELIDAGGLGSMLWLAQARACKLPHPFGGSD